MATEGLSLDNARAAVKASRPAINPNQGFLFQLQLFQEAGCSADGWHWDLERFLQVGGGAGSIEGRGKLYVKPEACEALVPSSWLKVARVCGTG